VLAVRRRYLIALAAAAVAAVLFVVLANNGGATTSGRSLADLARATAAVNRMKLPADFVRVSSFNPGVPCSVVGDRCYLVARPTTAVATTMPRLLRSVATVKSHDIFCTLLHPPHRAAMDNCAFVATVAGSPTFTVLVEPYIACSKPRHCELTNKSEVLIDGISASLPGATGSAGATLVVP
jgi:hypothetical protein